MSFKADLLEFCIYLLTKGSYFIISNAELPNKVLIKKSNDAGETLILSYELNPERIDIKIENYFYSIHKIDNYCYKSLKDLILEKIHEKTTNSDPKILNVLKTIFK